jgi:hypothetical protein
VTPTRGGFIVRHRKVLESRMATLPGSQFALAILMLLEANWKPSVIRWGGTERILQRGQLILSERGISERYGCDRQTIRDCLDALRRQETITTERTQHGTIVTWVNYLKYQDVDWQEEPTHPTTHPTTDPTTHPTDHNKGTRKQGNKKARQPSVDAALAASAIAGASLEAPHRPTGHHRHPASREGWHRTRKGSCFGLCRIRPGTRLLCSPDPLSRLDPANGETWLPRSAP